MTLYIGDVHGKFKRYGKLLKDNYDTIQVGDMGVGFMDGFGMTTSNPPFDKMVSWNARFIRGNHDNPEVCRNHRQWIKDGTRKDGVMYIGGAWSVDQAWRTPNESWWHDEELGIEELSMLVDKYEKYQPHTMVTHDCPESIVSFHYSSYDHTPSRTRAALQRMLTRHRPKLWVFGHWHHSFDQVIDGTRFVCLDELEMKELNHDG